MLADVGKTHKAGYGGKAGKTTFEDYEKEILNLRYRDGKLTDYTSRLHYFSDWIFDINKRGIGKDITKEIGGEKYNLKVLL